MDQVVQTCKFRVMTDASTFTAKGAATRQRIVVQAAQLVHVRGVAATTLDDVRGITSTSKSQLFHYFPAGKTDLVAAIIAHQGERTFAAQRPYLDQFDTWDAWDHWRRQVLAHYSSQRVWGCPLSALARELPSLDERRAKEAGALMDQWRLSLMDGLVRMRDTGKLKAFANPESLSLSTFASLHGGLLLTQLSQSIRPLESALDGALELLHGAAAS